MKQIQSRYLYAAIFGSIFFIICYGLLDFNILIILSLTIVIYIGCVFMFKEKDIRMYSPELVNNYYFLASKVANAANGTNENITSLVEEITNLTDQILISLEQRPKKVEQVFDFFDYYLDFTYKLLIQYKSLINKENKNETEKKFLDTTEYFLKNIVEAFTKQYKNMQESKMMDMNVEIKIFEKTVGMKKENLNSGEGSENHGQN